MLQLCKEAGKAAAAQLNPATPIGQRIALSFASTHPMVCFAAEVACGHVTAVDTSRQS
jgi:hypothetical protein